MANTNNITSSSRRYDLDWLRVIAFSILIFFHVAVAFLPHGLPLTRNAESSELLALFVAFLHNFRLALLFFVSGCGVFFAMRTRGRAEFFKERRARLLPPLMFGIAVLVPIMVYFEKRYLGVEFDSFLHFYAQYYTSGVYPEGNLSWHHYWFVAYLYLMCLLAWPIVRWVRDRTGKVTLLHWVQRYRLDGYGMYLFIVPLLLIEILLRPLFPGFRDLISDWASFSHWFIVFLLGFWFAFDRRLLAGAEQLRAVSLCLALATALLLFWQFWQADASRLHPFEGNQTNVWHYIWFCTLRITSAWCCILTCVGYASRYLNYPSNLLARLNQSVFAVFCLHLPILVVLEYLILPLSLSVAAKFFLISFLAILMLSLLYSVLLPLTFIHPLIGIKVRKTCVADSGPEQEDQAKPTRGVSS